MAFTHEVFSGNDLLFLATRVLPGSGRY